MTTVSEWTHMESSMDAMAPSSDLFDGDILGDELMDIYNAAVVGGSDDDAMNEIPSLLGPEQLHDIDQSDESMMNHPGAQVAEAAAAIDDGFGAFRPSTSFNDLSSLLPPADVPSAPHAMTSATATAPIATTTTVHYSQPIAPVVSSTSLAPIPAPQVAVKPSVMASPDGGKRKLTTLPDGPATKKQRSVNNTVRKNACAGPKKKAATGRVVNDGKKNTTPNPLKANSPTPALVRVTPVAPIAHAPKLELVKPIAKAIQPPPVVVTPPTTTQSAVVKTPPEASAPAPVAPAPVVSAAPPTEADFKSVAQAAVSNLIMNAGSSKSDATKDSDSSGVIDTSTEHIKALTGSNWVAVCNGGGDLPIDDSDDTVVDKMGNRARRQNLTPDERARQNRDRNREHARNTRLRKKAYVEELKRTLTALVSQRDASDLEKRHSSQRELEQREVRFRVAEEFLKLRGRNEANPARWAAILEDNFTLTLPVTDFREMVHSGDGHLKVVQEQVLTGVAETMRDSTMCSAFLQGLGRGHEVVTLSYNCDRKDFFMDNCTAMLEFTATSQGVVQQGAIAEFNLKGNIRAKFSPASNKLISIVMMFDTGVIMSQVNQIVKSSVHEVDSAAAAAQHAASEADAILDSLQMPHIEPSVMPVNVVPLSSGSSTGSDGENKGLDSSDEDKEDSEFGDDSHGMPSRRPLRRKD